MRLFFLFFALGVLPTFAANHYVRAGASGTGTDWANACADFTGSCAVASLVRGDAYYVANGTYAQRTWNTATSGTLTIVIKKATVADHGTATGWSDAYGNGQAVFTGAGTIATSYWTFDGQIGDYATKLPYGFMFHFSEGDTAMKVNVPSGTAFTFRYIDFDGRSASGNYNYTANTKGFEVWDGNDWTLSHCSIHGGESLMQGGGNNVLVEYSYLYNSRSTASAWHGNVFFVCCSTGGTFRYNRIWDYNDEGLFFTGYTTPPNNWKVYGNVFSGTGAEQNPRGIEIRQDYNYSGLEFYNNTFVNLSVGGLLNRTLETGNTCSGCIARNNLSYNAGNTLTGMTASSNTDDEINRFVNLAASDFRLAAALPGENLAVAFNLDLLGNTRGSEGTWDRGAFEFGGTSLKPQPPTGLTSVVR